MATGSKTSRDEILKAIRRKLPQSAELPSLTADWVAYDDRFARFQELVERVGGRCVRVADADAIARDLAALPQFASAKKIISLAPEIVAGNIDLNDLEDPHQTEDIDFAIGRAEFAVAENGAVWVHDQGVKHRAVFFLVQHLALIVPADRILDNLHQAYEQLAFPDAGFGVFISGPSKTADIEQSLVIGAHGPRSLTVFCL